mmetsp:Transcript_60459/g.126533  ORF Transcript_60459/g.126533 Transcript_60459/m.126533 type:complete len:219 (-) Transcript_60459:217-873(-)
MSLADILSLDGLNFELTPIVQDRVLKLRLVSRKVMMALESNIFLKIHIRINDSGAKGLKVDFLRKWHGSVYLRCTLPWEPSSTWFKHVKDDLLSDQLRPLSLLSLLVAGNNLHPLVETLAKIGPAIQQLEIAYKGNGTELRRAAARLASFGRALTMKVSVQGRDRGGGQTSSWLRHPLASSTRINSIAFSDNDLGAAGATALASGLTALTNLQSIDIG